MILSDRTIREQLGTGRIVIDPLDDTCIQPSSVDLRLDRLFRVFLNHTMPVIDVKQDLADLTRLVEIDDDDAFILHPGEFVLGSTYERVGLPDDLVARIEGKSSLGRLGLLIHSTAGFVDAGFSGGRAVGGGGGGGGGGGRGAGPAPRGGGGGPGDAGRGGRRAQRPARP